MVFVWLVGRVRCWVAQEGRSFGEMSVSDFLQEFGEREF